MTISISTFTSTDDCNHAPRHPRWRHLNRKLFSLKKKIQIEDDWVAVFVTFKHRTLVMNAHNLPTVDIYAWKYPLTKFSSRVESNARRPCLKRLQIQTDNENSFCMFFTVLATEVARRTTGRKIAQLRGISRLLDSDTRTYYRVVGLVWKHKV